MAVGQDGVTMGAASGPRGGGGDFGGQWDVVTLLSTPRSGRFVVGGDSDGFVTVWDTWRPLQCGRLPACLRFNAVPDCVNGARWGQGL